MLISPLKVLSPLGGSSGSRWTPQITVGVGKDYQTISAAIAAAPDHASIIIDAGVYNEAIDLTVKKLKLIGLTTGAIIYNQAFNGVNMPLSALNVATDSVFQNIIFKKIYVENTTPIINISGCKPIFDYSQIIHDTNWDVNPMTISNGSVVNWRHGAINSFGVQASFNSVTVKDTSVFNFTGTIFKAKMNTLDSSVANINVDEYWVNTNGSIGGLKAEDDSRVYLHINTREVNMSAVTGLEVGTYSTTVFTLLDNANLELSGNQLINTKLVSGAGCKFLLKDIVTTSGIFWAFINNLLPNALTTFDNCKIKTDSLSPGGQHMYECDGVSLLRIINGCVLEFIGSSGNAGQPIESRNLYMRDSQVIDTLSDDVATYYTGVINTGGYASQVVTLDIENSMLTIRNWTVTGISPYVGININKSTGGPLHIRLVNTTFESDVTTGNGGFAINLLGAAIEAGDYIIATGLINHTQEANICNDMAKWNQLISQAP